MSSNSRHKTHRGREFNMSAFVEKNGAAKAVGNASMNGRGDIIDAKGNVKIPTQTITRTLSNIQNNESKQVSLKADETITSVQNTPVNTDPVEVSRRTIVNIDGSPATEIEYSDGSIQVIANPTTPTSL